jgi:hypothetical protein
VICELRQCGSDKGEDIGQATAELAELSDVRGGNLAVGLLRYGRWIRGWRFGIYDIMGLE